MDSNFPSNPNFVSKKIKNRLVFMSKIMIKKFKMVKYFNCFQITFYFNVLRIIVENMLKILKYIKAFLNKERITKKKWSERSLSIEMKNLVKKEIRSILNFISGK